MADEQQLSGLIGLARKLAEAGDDEGATQAWEDAADWCRQHHDPRAEGLSFKAAESKPRRCYWRDLKADPPAYPLLPCPEPSQVLDLAELMDSVFFERSQWVQWYLEYQPLLDCSALVCAQDNTAMGACLLDGEARGATVAVVLVAPQHRGQGLGRGLLGSCLSRLATAGRRAVLAHIHPGNEASIRTFEACGFQPIEELGQMLCFAQRSGFVSQRDLRPLVPPGQWEQVLAECADRCVRIV